MEKEDREFLLRVVLGRNWNRKSYGTSGGLPVNIALMQSAVQQLTQKSHHFARRARCSCALYFGCSAVLAGASAETKRWFETASRLP